MRGNFTSFNPIKQAASNLITTATAKTKKPQSDNNHRGVTHKLDVMCVRVCVCMLDCWVCVLIPLMSPWQVAVLCDRKVK